MLNQFPPTSCSSERTWVVEAQAAEITGMSLAWFRKKRQTGGGIPFTKLGRNVKYELADIYAYIDQRKVSSTSEYKAIANG
jgi:predicted DNA-binding transcriptional regulator AlpA